MQLFETMAVHCLLYGSESWILTFKNTAQIQFSEMRFLRSIEDYTLLNLKRTLKDSK